MTPLVEIYSTSTCHFCREAKEFFVEKKIEFVEYDVANDAAKRDEMIRLTGQLGVPVIMINGEALVGFDSAEVLKKLAIENQ